MDRVMTENNPTEHPNNDTQTEPIDAEQLEKFAHCERRIGYTFSDRSLLLSALTHASGADHRLASNERLEFLGDAILGAVVCEILFRQYPDYLEGDLTKIKSVVVSRQSCAKISEALGLQEFLIVGKGMAASDDVPPSLLADVFESLLAAIYLDGGDEAARRFVEEYIGPEIELAAAGELGGNYKSLLQQFAQREFGNTPVYQLLDEKGPDHAKCFKVCAYVGGTRYQGAWGRNKKEAEQRAACNALSELKGESAPFPSD
jgi:ribonuclease-3